MAALAWPWRILSVLYVIPRPIRDVGYRIVAHYRYAIFGHADECRAPSQAFQARFLEYDNNEGQDNVLFVQK